MAGDLGRLVVKIGADTKNLNDGLKKSSKRMGIFGKNTGKILKSAGAAFVAFAAIAVVALTKVIKSSIKYGVQLDAMNKLVGISAAKFAKLSFAIEQEHGSVQALTKVFPILAQRMRDSQAGLETYAIEFRFLGVQFETTEGKMRELDDVLLDFADSFEKSSDQVATLGSLTKLLGVRIAKELIPLFKTGKKGIEAFFKEFEAFGLADEQIIKFAKDAKRFDDRMTTLNTQFKLAGLILTSKLLPPLENFADAMIKVDWIGIGEQIGIWAENMLAFGKAVGKVAGFLAKLPQLFDPISGFVGPAARKAGGGQALQGPGQATGLAGGGGDDSGIQGQAIEATSGMVQGLDAFMDKITEATDKWDEFNNFFTESGEAMGELFNATVEGMFTSFGDAFAGMAIMGESFSESITKAFKSLASQFVAAIATMIAKWIAFIAAVMAIAIVLAFFNVPIGETFKAAFNLLAGKDSEGGLAGKAVGKAGSIIGLREGGAFLGGADPISARNGLAISGMGVRTTGAFGEAGIPATLHPNEAVIPMDQLKRMVSGGGGVNITINGFNRDPRELADMVGLEVERRRRAP